MNQLTGFEKIEVAIKNVLFGLMTDLEKFKILQSFNYSISAKDFNGVGSRLFRLCEKMKKDGFKKLTPKMILEAGIKEEEVKEYFKEIKMTDAEDFKLYMKELSVAKAVDSVSKKLYESIKVFDNIQGSNDFERMDGILSEIKKGIGRLDSLKKTEKGQNLLELNAAFQDISVSSMAIKTGLKQIDDIIGGFKRGETSLLSGVSNQGKTTFANQIMVYIAYVLGLRVLYINLELTDKNAYAKALGLITGKGYAEHNPDTYDETKPEDVKAWTERAVKDTKILKDTVGDRLEVRTASINENQIINTIYEADAEGFDIIFVDYFQLIDVGTDDNKAKAQKLSDLATNIRNAVKETNLAMVLLTQLKENKKEEPMTFEISWSRDLYKTAGLELRVWRNYIDEATGEFDNKIMVGFPKTRFSERPAPIEFLFDGAVGRIGTDFASVNDSAVSVSAGLELMQNELADLFRGKEEFLNYAEMNVSFIADLESAAQERRERERRTEALKETVKTNNEVFERKDFYNEQADSIVFVNPNGNGENIDDFLESLENDFPKEEKKKEEQAEELGQQIEDFLNSF